MEDVALDDEADEEAYSLDDDTMDFLNSDALVRAAINTQTQSLIDDRRRRTRRALKRSFCRLRQTRGSGECCCICLETLDNHSTIPVTTVCDHSMHEDCWLRYTSNYVDEHTNMENPEISDTFRAFLLYNGGPPCPMCRREFPFVHNLAYALQDPLHMAVVRDISTLTTDLSLMIASTKP